MGHAQSEKHIFLQKLQKQIINFQNLFISPNYRMFWLSYESFNFVWCFLSKKGHFQLKQLFLPSFNINKIKPAKTENTRETSGTNSAS